MGNIFKAVTGLVGSLFGSTPEPAPAPAPAATPTPAAPTPAPPPVMPVADDKAVKLAAQKRMAQKNASRTTRQSSILSEDTGADTLGG